MSDALKDRPRPRVLVIRGGAIGDFILTLPAIRMLKENIANAYVEVLGYTPIIEVAKADGLADATRSLEHVAMSKLFVPGVQLDAALVEYFRSFNLVVSYLFDPDGILRDNLEKAGVKTLLEMPHRVTADGGHAVEQLARPLEKLAMFLEDPAPRLLIGSEVRQDAGCLVVLHPGSGSLLKNWPASHWLEVGRSLLQQDERVKIAWVTGEAEQERGITEQVKGAFQQQGERVQWWDQLPLAELAKRMRRARFFLGHDSGIGHLAAASGLPGLLLFGPTDPQVWAPRNEGMEVYLEPSRDLLQLSLADGKERLLAFSRRFLDKK